MGLISMGGGFWGSGEGWEGELMVFANRARLNLRLQISDLKIGAVSSTLLELSDLSDESDSSDSSDSSDTSDKSDESAKSAVHKHQTQKWRRLLLKAQMFFAESPVI